MYYSMFGHFSTLRNKGLKDVKLAWDYLQMLWGYRGSSFCGTPAKKMQNLRPATSEIIILRLRHHERNQVAIFNDLKL